MATKLCILNIGAHPADLIDDAGGTSILHADRGDRVVGVTLTRGTRVHDKVLDRYRTAEKLPAPDQLQAIMTERAEVKKQEVIQAAGIIGIEELHFLEYDEEVFTVTETLTLELAALLRKVRPDIVITHYPLENAGIASDHAQCGRLTLEALSAAAGIHVGDSNPPHRVAQVFFRALAPAVYGPAGALSAQVQVRVDVYIDISRVVDRKVRALDCLQSQNYAGALARKMVECFDGVHGAPAGVPYAESFIRHRAETYDYLPVEEFTLRRARETETELFQRRNRMWVHALPRDDTPEAGKESHND